MPPLGAICQRCTDLVERGERLDRARVKATHLADVSAERTRCGVKMTSGTRWATKLKFAEVTCRSCRRKHLEALGLAEHMQR